MTPYTPPTIRHIDDVLPSVEGRSDFVVAKRDGYTVIDYNYALPDSFDDPLRVECRGIKFGADGAILARPFQKFFNIGEREDTQPDRIDFTRPHVIMHKLDGSMIHPALVDGELVFMTRMGRTDHAIKAERHLDDELRMTCRALLRGGSTPIFEWTAPDNRIVVPYQESAITLLAVRNTEDGAYWPHDLVAGMAMNSVPTISPTWSTAASFVEYARAILGAEGFVVRFADGGMVKAKGADYVLKHRAKDSISHEKNILALVLTDGLDDVLPLLDPADHARVRAYREAVMGGIVRTAALLEEFCAARAGVDQKTFAIEHVPTLPIHLRPLAFRTRTGGNPLWNVRDAILSKAGTQTAVNDNRPLHGATWAA